MPRMSLPLLDVVLRQFDEPDERREFSNGRFEVVRIGGLPIGRATYEPGWKWSEDVGRSLGRQRCEVEHVGLVLSGMATVAFGDGRVVELRAGELFHVPAMAHDSWVVGNQPYISLHFLGAAHYATGGVSADANCFVCGADNPVSLGVAFQPDDAGGSRAIYVPRREHEGWPGILHGGALFAVLDDAAGWAARYSGRPSVTGRATIRYRQPVPTSTPMVVTGRVRARGRLLVASAHAARRDTSDVVADFEATLFPR
jgi:acyl-coenzyme A thioesterase PaaI-like protein